KQITAFNSQTNQKLQFAYDKLLIAVGASPVRPPIKGLDAPHVYTMHSRQDAQDILATLPEVNKVSIIGAGFIGVEAAEAFRERGKSVTLLEFAPRVMERVFDEQISALLETELHAKGVALHTSETVTEITTGPGAVNTVITDKGEYESDMVILSTGFRPNTDFLRETGLAIDTQGALLIDDLCQTNLPDIYAAGDCAVVRHRISGNRYIPLATTANKLGRLAGDVMAGNSRGFIGTLGSSGIRVFDLEAGRTGISESEATQLDIDYGIVFIQDKNHTDYVHNQSDMWVKLIYNKTTRQLLGGQICGAFRGGAVQRVNALAVAIYSGLTVDELGYMDFVYAPPFARTWDILNIAGNVAK
ncbi:MAG: FAD-dependent oxidoreductase, partial [Enterobacteriaceae bacterium]